MDNKTRNRLMDMRDYAVKAVGFCGPMSLEEFTKDERTSFATVRAIEIIGEAAAQVGRETLEQIPSAIDNKPNLPWKEIIGMRNILIHQYSGISMSMVHETATNFLPDFIEHLNLLLDTDT